VKVSDESLKKTPLCLAPMIKKRGKKNERTHIPPKFQTSFGINGAELVSNKPTTLSSTHYVDLNVQ